jgi:uncharacterized protein YwqG
MGFTVPGPQWSAYVDIDTAYPGTVHRLLGHPDPIQGDMQQECQFASHGLRPGEAGESDAELLGGAVDWRLLLQVDSQDEVGMMWSDVGRIYFWITEGALAAADWQDCWLILQCT